MSKKTITQIYADSFYGECPYCEDSTYLGDDDPRDADHVCENCGEIFHVTAEAKLEDYH